MYNTISHTNHQVSSQDEWLVAAIEQHQLQLAEFNHQAHLSMAYVYLARGGFDRAFTQMSETLKKYLKAKGVDAGKFHLTLTWAWLKAVWHFMRQSAPMSSAKAFLEANPVLLNKDILLSHYSHDRLFSDRARRRLVHPDLNPFPDAS
jgi:hypothetical protein